uniref:Uncharacterized protein n=1 Tax=Streptomyces sp. NBC_00003 TaxID=2903608 RepID=A0AAU2UXB8_9ACTN
MTREQQLAQAFVSLSDTYAHDLDPVLLLDRLTAHCVHLVGADAAGVMVATIGRAGVPNRGRSPGSAC